MESWQTVVLAVVQAAQVVLLAWIARRQGNGTKAVGGMLERFEDKIRKRIERLPGDSTGPVGPTGPPPPDYSPFWQHVMDEWRRKNEGAG